MESSGRQLSKNTKYAIVHALIGKKVRYQAVYVVEEAGGARNTLL